MFNAKARAELEGDVHSGKVSIVDLGSHRDFCKVGSWILEFPARTPVPGGPLVAKEFLYVGSSLQTHTKA